MSEIKTDLLSYHKKILSIDSGISDSVILSRGYRSVLDSNELLQLGFAPGQCRVPGLVIPLHTTDGKIGLYIYRPDNPRVLEQKNRGKNPDGTFPCKVLKYEIPKGAGVRLDCPPVCQPILSDPKIPLWVTEGQKKADSLASQGLCTIALLGVWNFKGRNDFGGVSFLADWDYIALKGREVRIIFDSDIQIKPQVHQALERLREHLIRRGALVHVVYLPHTSSNGKVGIDDWLATGHSIQELEDLIEKPGPVSKSTEPDFEILDDEPQIMTRPLMIFGDHAYAATWLSARVKKTQTIDRKGNITHHNPALKTIEENLYVVRNDGVVFGKGRNKSLDELDLILHLDEKPPAQKIWGARGIKSYAQGKRPDPKDIFKRIVAIIHHFLDFDQSLADQATMAEFIACYILSTWFLESFNVCGFLWANGERGSGKTTLLIIVSELSYLGQLILASGSFASLRDMADYGATLAFDDAENLSDHRKGDPDKRALFLAGNRRGVFVTLKELTRDKTWKTRRVNAYCPRCFSAIQIPDPVLASRSIIIPLVRTVDRDKANRDPFDFKVWPYEPKELVDDLWALSLSKMIELKKWDEWVGTNTSLSGRALQPWRAILSVAAWLEKNGVVGLYERLDNLSVSYQTDRQEIELPDLTQLVIRGLYECAISAIKTNRAIQGNDGQNVSTFDFTIRTSEIVEVVREIVQSDEELGFNLDELTNWRVGRVLGKLRIKKVPRPGGKGSRKWSVTSNNLRKMMKSYGLNIEMSIFDEAEQDIPSARKIDGVDSTNGDDGKDGVDGTDGANGTDGTKSINDVEEITLKNIDIPQRFISVLQGKKVCFACGGVDFKNYPNSDGSYCTGCHPDFSRKAKI